MGLLNAGSSGWRLRWAPTASKAISRQVDDERRGWRPGFSPWSRRRRRSPDGLRARSLHDRLLAEDGEVQVDLSFSDHLSHTTPSPSPSLALGTIHLGKPLPLPLLPCTRVSPAACAASQELYVLISDVSVCCTGLLVGPGVGFTWLWRDTISSGRFAHVLSIWTRAECSCWMTVSSQVLLMVIQSTAYWHQ